MGKESDSKSQLVLEICSLSTRSIPCSHRHRFPTNSSKPRPLIDWYRLLGVEENAEINVIRNKYRKLALQLHPDKNKHPKAEVAFKLVLEAYSCLSDDVKRRAFDFERCKNFCSECDSRMPYKSRNSFSFSNVSASKLKESNPVSGSRLSRQSLKEIKSRFKEEAEVMEKCLRANRKESPLFTPSDHLFQKGAHHCRSRKESPVFDPSNYLFEGYPHTRGRIYKKPENFCYLQRKNVLHCGQGTGGYDSPIFENRSDIGLFRSKSTCVRS